MNREYTWLEDTIIIAILLVCLCVGWIWEKLTGRHVWEE